MFIGLFPDCRSISCPSVCFRAVCLFPVVSIGQTCLSAYFLCYFVSCFFSCFQRLSLLRIHTSISVCLFPCQSDCFLTVCLFPVHQSVSELSVPFPVLRIGLTCLSDCFLSIGLFPVFRSVSYPLKSVCVLLIIIFQVYRHVFCPFICYVACLFVGTVCSLPTVCMLVPVSCSISWFLSSGNSSNHFTNIPVPLFLLVFYFACPPCMSACLPKILSCYVLYCSCKLFGRIIYYKPMLLYQRLPTPWELSFS